MMEDGLTFPAACFCKRFEYRISISVDEFRLKNIPPRTPKYFFGLPSKNSFGACVPKSDQCIFVTADHSIIDVFKQVSLIGNFFLSLRALGDIHDQGQRELPLGTFVGCQTDLNGDFMTIFM